MLFGEHEREQGFRLVRALARLGVEESVEAAIEEMVETRSNVVKGKVEIRIEGKDLASLSLRRAQLAMVLPPLPPEADA